MGRARMVLLFTILVLVLIGSCVGWSGGPFDTTANLGTAAVASDQLPSALDTSVSLPEHASSGWWASVQEDIRQSEYNVTWQDRTYLPDVPGAYHAPNRGLGLRTYFLPNGIRVIPRTESTPSWEWGMSLAEYGHGADLVSVDEGELVTNGNRIEYRRSGISEWYVSEEDGISHGIKVERRPVLGPFDRGPLEIYLTLSEDTFVALADDGRGITLSARDGREVLGYGAIEAVDTAGKLLPLTVSLSGAHLSFQVDDAEGVYPITLFLRVNANGLSATADWTAESGQIDARLGVSVSTAGDVNGDGYSDVIVGAYLYDNGQTDEGHSFVYYGSASGLSATADWTAESDQENARLGYSVRTAGDVNGDGYSDVIVGAYLYDNEQTNEGRAYIYHGSASGLGTAADWTAESDQVGAFFGYSVGTAGDVNGDGYSDVIVGAYLYGNDPADEGRAYVYHGSASGLSATADWTAESNQASAYFGKSVGTAGDVNGDGYSDVIVGAWSYDNGQTNEGRAYVYHGSTSGLSATADWTAESDQATAQFGNSVGMAGDVNGDGYSDVIIGVYLYDNGQPNEGAVFVYHGSASGLSATADWTAESDQATAQFGNSVGMAGDVNGDGYSDVIIGANLYDNGQTDEGAVFVYHGSVTGLSTTPDWTAEGDQTWAWFGLSVGNAGDVNGDGYSDVIVGAYRYDNGEGEAGRVFVYHGFGSPHEEPLSNLTQWGLIAMAGVLATLVLRRLRRSPTSGVHR